MRGDLQQRIAPVVAPNTMDFNTGKTKRQESSRNEDVDFLKVLNNSNADKRKERAAQANGDLSGAKNYDDFLQKLNDQTKKERVPKNKLDKNDFLKLFVTQLQNQDPLNPEDNTEMASRLAHFNSLEQMLNVNKTLGKILDGQNTSRSVDLVNYIGKEVSLSNGRVKMENGKVSEGHYRLKMPAANSSLEVRDGTGTIVFKKALGTLKQGEHKIDWNGLNVKGEKVPNGVYTFAITAKGIKGEEIPIEIETKAKITGVDMQSKDGGLFTNLGEISMSDIKAIGVQGFQGAGSKQVKDAAGKGAPAKDAAKGAQPDMAQMQKLAQLMAMQNAGMPGNKQQKPGAVKQPGIAQKPGITQQPGVVRQPGAVNPQMTNSQVPPAAKLNPQKPAPDKADLKNVPVVMEQPKANTNLPNQPASGNVPQMK